jgi:XTP/dITP diphosphohydrolase
MVLAQDGEVLTSFDGAVEGRMLSELHGEGGFGYDPLFVPDGYDQTFSQLSEGIKNQLSHRAVAMQKVVAWLATSPR